MQPGRGSDSGFPALPLLFVAAKIKSFHVWLLLHLLGALQEHRRHRQTFQGKQSAARSAARANGLIKLTGPSSSTEEKSQEPSKTVGAPWLTQQTWIQASLSRQMGLVKFCEGEICTGTARSRTE